MEDASARRRAQLILLGLLSIWAIAVSWLILEAASIFELRGA